jgi:hypothetical protein
MKKYDISKYETRLHHIRREELRQKRYDNFITALFEPITRSIDVPIKIITFKRGKHYDHEKINHSTDCYCYTLSRSVF